MSSLVMEIMAGLIGLLGLVGVVWNSKRKAKKRGVEETERKAKEADYEKAYAIRKRRDASRLRKPNPSSDNRGNRD